MTIVKADYEINEKFSSIEEAKIAIAKKIAETSTKPFSRILSNLYEATCEDGETIYGVNINDEKKYIIDGNSLMF